MKKILKTYRYSRHFKQEVLTEIKHGNLTVTEASRFYGVAFQTIYYWIKKFGYSNPTREVIYVSLKDKQNFVKQLEKLQKENQKLKEAVSDLSLDKLCLEKMIEVAERDYDLDIKKKSATKVSKKSEN